MRKIRIRTLSDVFVPDFQQAQEDHKELLKKAEQERAAKKHTSKPASSRGLGLLRQLLTGRPSKKLAKTASCSLNDQTQ